MKDDGHGSGKGQALSPWQAPFRVLLRCGGELSALNDQRSMMLILIC